MMGSPALANESVEQVYRRITAGAEVDTVTDLLARMIASWLSGFGAMPDWFGLDERDFTALLDLRYPGFRLDRPLPFGRPLAVDRLDEMEDLRTLLGAQENPESAGLMTHILVVGCMGDDHLWQDLGLWSRTDLSRLMQICFPELAKRNDKDMKWKKFLYKQLCEAEGIYTCRAPSCEVCADYSNCFGPEE